MNILKKLKKKNLTYRKASKADFDCFGRVFNSLGHLLMFENIMRQDKRHESRTIYFQS